MLQNTLLLHTIKMHAIQYLFHIFLFSSCRVCNMMNLERLPNSQTIQKWSMFKHHLVITGNFFFFPQQSIHYENRINMCLEIIWHFQLFEVLKSLIYASAIFITNLYLLQGHSFFPF